MHGIFVATGSRGDLYPVLGLGRAMRAAGHDVTIITTANFEPEVRGAGLKFVQIADAATYSQVGRWFEFRALQRRPPRRWPDEIVTTLLEMRERLLDLVRGVVTSDATFLAVNVALDLGVGEIVASKLGIPRVGVWLNPHMATLFRPRLPRILMPLHLAIVNGLLRLSPPGRDLRRHDVMLRKRLGLASGSNLAKAMFRFDVSVGLFPSWFLPGHVQRSGMHFAGFPLYEPDADLPPALKDFLDTGEPPIVFSNASWRGQLDDYHASALDVARELGYRAVCIGAPSRAFADAQQDAIWLDYAPLGRLLPRTAALVHHGGIGTVARAMAEATPQLIVPWGVDQPFNGSRVKSLGVGLSLGLNASRREFAMQLKEVVDSPRIRANNVRVARRLQHSPDYRDVLRSLEMLIGGRSPGQRD